MTDLEAFDELSYYTLSRGDAGFIHQHAVDAYAAQYAGEGTKPITLVFGLVGLHLAVERGWTGRQVQLFHMKMARHKRPWPELPMPVPRGDIRIGVVLAAAPGAERDARIMDWCRSVWDAYADARTTIRNLAADFDALP